jgi:hypothetical protein
MGEAGKEQVLRNFLITKHLKDYFKLLGELMNLGVSSATSLVSVIRLISGVGRKTALS